ncbi:MAG: response regulator transcription factor [Bacteroidota bacterium]
MLNVLLAEDHNIVRNGIRMLLELDQTIHIAAEAGNGLQVLDLLRNGIDVDVVLADINMPELDGISLIAKLKALKPEVKVVILSMHETEKYVTAAFVEGASGYLLKNVSSEELLFALKHIHQGGRYLCAELAIGMLDKAIQQGQSSIPSDLPKIDISLREMEVLQLIAEGLTNSEMSDKLFISKRTIEGHRQNLIDKTGSKNTAALIRYAIQNRLIN